ncbi:metallophosphoesterase family protein [Desulfoscipio geothermicus]|uniref:Calcineurin-like phosphoesterase n=1 Tax=Desulfoscipio geothermicus DSM 3669 TaxID=1121426 RepID=A0A1I6E9Z9_9FIRM|nr:metallophosphoesterase [Desulfoscipio geothermicus]SFR14550.1 Calcineurin-like phosphoesterase [Desulfoscipio geothermicus DSM 3669]
MSVLEFCRGMVFRATGRIYVPPEIKRAPEKKILHISDTPTEFYPAVKDLITELKPQVLIHTGDLADDIKLELDPGKSTVYRRAAASLIALLEESCAGKIYITPGNHDMASVIDEYSRHARLVGEGEIISVGDMSLGLAHRVKKLPVGTDFNLYGHNFHPGPRDDRYRYLNGLNEVNIIFYPSRRVYKLPYPWSINAHRKMDAYYGLPGSI